MSDSIKEIAFKNGQDAAFARPGSGDNHPSYGLTKREYLAAMAMQGIFASVEGNEFPNIGECAKKAVESADALLLELEKGN